MRKFVGTASATTMAMATVMVMDAAEAMWTRTEMAFVTT